LATLPKIFWTRVLGSVVIQLYAGECTPSVNRALRFKFAFSKTREIGHFLLWKKKTAHKQSLMYTDAHFCSKFKNKLRTIPASAEKQSFKFFI